jgi:hypothetical protein
MPDLKSTTTYEVTIKGIANNQAVINVFHVRTLVVGSPPDRLQDLLTAIRARWRSTILTQLCDNYYVDQYIIKEIVSAPTPITVTYGDEWVIPFEDPDDYGAITTGPVPLHANVTVRLLTAMTGRSRRGSKRFTPIPEADTLTTDGSMLTTAAHAAWQGIVDSWLASYSLPETTAVNVVFSNKIAQAVSIADGSGYIEGGLVNWIIGSQISRKIKAGV